MSRRSVFDRVKAATVAIAGMDAAGGSRHPFEIIGSGFCIDPQGLIVTCRHVVDGFLSTPTLELVAQSPAQSKDPVELPPVDLRHIEAVFYVPLDDARLAVVLAPVSHVACKTDFDLALLRVKPDGRFSGGFPSLEVGDPKDIREGDEIATCGFPLGTVLHDVLGTVTNDFCITNVLYSSVGGAHAPTGESG